MGLFSKKKTKSDEIAVLAPAFFDSPDGLTAVLGLLPGTKMAIVKNPNWTYEKQPVSRYRLGIIHKKDGLICDIDLSEGINKLMPFVEHESEDMIGVRALSSEEIDDLFI